MRRCAGGGDDARRDFSVDFSVGEPPRRGLLELRRGLRDRRGRSETFSVRSVVAVLAAGRRGECERLRRSAPRLRSSLPRVRFGDGERDDAELLEELESLSEVEPDELPEEPDEELEFELDDAERPRFCSVCFSRFTSTIFFSL